MAALTDFAKYVRPEVTGCPEIQILDAVLRASIQFCKRSREIKEVVLITSVIGQAEYAIPVATGLVPEEVLEVKRNDEYQLDASSFHSFKNMDLNTLQGSPEYYYQNTNDELVLGKIPNLVQEFLVTVRVRPEEDATTVPDYLFTRYRDEIAAGAKSRLMVMKGQPWTDISQAGLYRTLFEEAVASSNLREAQGAARKPVRTVSQYF